MVQDIGTFGVASRWGHVEGSVGDYCGCGGGYGLSTRDLMLWSPARESPKP